MSVIATDKRTLVVGLGVTGLSCVRFLHGQGRRFAVADNRSTPPGLDILRRDYPDVPLYLGDFSADVFSRFDELVVSPGISVHTPAIQAAREAGARISGDIDLFSQVAGAPIVGITGSNGKSTVTTLLGEMAKAAGIHVAVGGNLGVPALDLLSPDVELYVLELSSFQLETTECLGALAATVLNVSDDHMDRYASRLEYFQAKQRIFNGCREAIVNLDDPLSQPLARDTLGMRFFGFGRVNPATFGTRREGDVLWITHGFENLLRTDELRLRGTHNIANVMAALALGEAAGLPMGVMLDVARRFEGLPHRCQPVRTLDGVEYINDSKGTNVGATVAAIESLVPHAGRLVLIAGGDGKGADFAPLAKPVARTCRGVVLIGRDARPLADALSGACALSFADSLEDAVQQARAQAQPGDTVLLSPACASLDMFRNYEERGLRFAQAVEAL